MHHAPIFPQPDTPERIGEITLLHAANKKFDREREGVLQAISKLIVGELKRSRKALNEAHETSLSIKEIVDQYALTDLIGNNAIELIEKSVLLFTLADIQHFEDVLDEELRREGLAARASEIKGLGQLVGQYFLRRNP